MGDKDESPRYEGLDWEALARRKWQKLDKSVLAELRQMPLLGSTQKQRPLERMIYEHFSVFGTDWYAAEYSPKERKFFGFVYDAREALCGWRYFSWKELKLVGEGHLHVEREITWKPVKAADVRGIRYSP